MKMTESTDSWIETRYGEFHIDEPKVNPEDIAHALAMLCRYNGHTRIFYSVAEHSLLVAGLMAELKLGDPFEGLMHDAAEAYITDIPGPWKSLVPDAVALEHRVERAIRQQFNLPEHKTDGCAKADRLALFIESYYLMANKGANYVDVLGIRPEALRLINDHWKVHGFDPNLAAHLWMKGFKHYGPKIEVVEGDAEMQAARAASGQESGGPSLVIP